MSKKNDAIKQIPYRLPVWMWEAVRDVARREDVSVTVWLRRAVEQRLRRYGVTDPQDDDEG